MDSKEATEQVKPTERPWRVSNAHGLCVAGEKGVIADCDQRLVSDPGRAQADAELIVRAVNSHDALVDLAYKGFALAAWVANTKEKNSKDWLQGLHELNKAFVTAYKDVMTEAKAQSE